MSALEFLEARPRWVGLVLAYLVLFSYLASQVGWTIDDAFITFRYSENAIAGHGPVYNPGEHVEGYTCFSWMALLAAIGSLGVPVPLVAKAGGMLCVFGSVTLFAFWDHVDDRISTKQATIGALALASTAAFVQWGASGMETPLFCLLALAVVFAYLRLFNRPSTTGAMLLGVLGCGLAMTRPNGVVLLCTIFGHALLNRRHLSQRIVVTIAVSFAVLYGSYFAWRWSYYGYFLPNTFYAKVGSTGAQINRGIRYLVSAMPAFGLLIVPIIASWGRAKDEADRWRGLLLALVVSHFVYVVAVGGDNFPAHRFLVVVVPFLWLLSIRAIPEIAPSVSRHAFLIALLIGYNFVAHGFDPETRSRIARDYVAREGHLVARWLELHTPDDAVIATNSAGALAYYSQRQIIDTLGLNDAEIAHTFVPNMGRGKAGHEKGNGAYVFERQPDYIIFGGPRGSSEPMFYGDRELDELTEFRERYAFERHKLTEDSSIQLFRRLSDEEIEERAEKKAKREEEAKKKAEKKAQAEKKKKAKERRRREREARAKAKAKAKAKETKPKKSPDAPR